MMPKAVITGGARPDGIGWATALAFAAKGYDVLVTGATEAEVAGADNHPHITAHVLDVRDDEAVRAIFNGLDRLDALVNCAGAADPQAEYTADGFARIVDINLTGTHRCCLAARELLAASKGSIVNVGSIYSTFGSGITPGYSASKGAVVQLTRSLAVAWGPDIRVNAVAPGWIRTGMAASVFDDQAWAAKLMERLPLSRFGIPSELADPIVFLCSPEARYISGVLLPVDGGYIVQG